jgi:hypothetical protein
MIGGATPELVLNGGRLMDLMLDAKLLRSGVSIGELLAPQPLMQLRQ